MVESDKPEILVDGDGGAEDLVLSSEERPRVGDGGVGV